MKKNILTIFITLLTLSIVGQKNKLPFVKLKNLEGKLVDVSTISKDGNPTIISFWATWCRPCKAELNTIAKEYDIWQKETGVRLVAISIDNSRSFGRVEPYIQSQAWDYEVLLDPNGELKKAMNVTNIPHTFLLDGKGNIVWDHNNYAPGDEKELYKQIKKISTLD